MVMQFWMQPASGLMVVVLADVKTRCMKPHSTIPSSNLCQNSKILTYNTINRTFIGITLVRTGGETLYEPLPHYTSREPLLRHENERAVMWMEMVMCIR